MIINLIEEKSNQIIITYMDEGNNILRSSSFSTKSLSDILSWKVYNEKIDSVVFTIISNSICDLYDINYNLPAFISMENFKIETSIDYINWYELEHKDSITNPTKYVFHSDPSLNIKEKPEYLYNNYEFQMLRITFSGLKGIINNYNQLKFNNLEILVDETFDNSYIKKKILSTRALMFTKPKIYNEYPFLPDILTTFMSMLEQNNSLGIVNEYKTTYLQKTNFNINYNVK